jgi:hypothetical protein
MVLERLPASPNTTERPFRIICADTCLQALEEWNVTPDLVVALESQHWNLRDFVGLGSWKIPVAIDLSALPATRDVLGGECLLFATPWTELRFFRRLKEAGLLPELIPPLGSVGLTTVAVARRLSTGPIVTSGLDFSYTLDSFHARSTPSHREKLYRQTRFKSILNGDAAFQAGTYKAVSKLGGSVRTNPSLKTYRDLFEREFAEDSRIKDIIGPGLPLGVETIGLEGALKILQEGGAKGRPPQTDIVPGPGSEAVKAFIHQEQAMLRTLRNMMTGEIPGDPEKLETLLDEADYLWSHFPECAGTGGRRPSGKDLSFLKRVRLEIDPLIRNFDLALREAGCHLPRTKGFF